MDTRKQPNRFLAILLSLCMVLAMLPAGSITAFAAGEETVISSDTTWETQTISNDVRIESGATLTINGQIIINDEVTIIGGGTIARGDEAAYFNIGSGVSLTLDGVTVDGKNISSDNSMFQVYGTLDIKNSTVQNCVKNISRGGAINVDDGTLTIENTDITNCSATGYGGAIYLRDNAEATIKSGTFSGNETTTSNYGGGFIYNRASTLIIEGGNFLNNSSGGRGGAIYNAGTEGTEAYILGGVFSGNTSNSSGYEGSGAVYYSSENVADTILHISGSVRFGNGGEGSGTDGIYLDTGSTGTALRKMQISSALQYPVHIYVACAENRVIAEGVNDYKLTAADMTKIQFHDVGSSGTDWYAWLDSTDNEVYVSETKPIYMVYDANGAAGSVTDNTAYSSGSQVTVQPAAGLTYEGAAFTGWNTEADGTGTTYQPESTFNITETTTLYAQWAYNIWAGGVQVTSSNASDVLGDADEGATVTYDAETNTLTLNGANITGTYGVPGGGNAAILSYDDLNIVLAEGSENKITLDETATPAGVIAVGESGQGNDFKNITVSGSGSLDIDITTSGAAAFGIAGGSVTIENSADVTAAVNGISTNEMVSYIGVMGYSSVAIKDSNVTATVSDKEGTNVAVMSTGAVTINNANVTASGYTGIMGMGGVSVTDESTVTATGSAYAIASAQTGNITLDGTLIARGREDAQSGTPSSVETGDITDGNTSNVFNTFVLPSDQSTVAKYVEIAPVSTLHYHNICGETDCTHEGHESAVYTALDSNISDQTLADGNYYLTEDITDVGTSILISGSVNLCLNGHTISGGAENGVIRVGENGVLTVCDCAGSGKITETGNDEHNPVFLHSGGALNLYGGTIESRITAVVIDEDPSAGGTNSTGGTVNVYGGTVKSTGSSSQAVKVNADMTNAAVNVYGGELTSPNRGIWAESGEITISGGTVNGNIETADNVTMTGGTLNGQLTIDSSLSVKKSVKISGSAKIEATSGNAIYSAGDIDLEISGGTISAPSGYAVFLTSSQSKVYLSGSPLISGGSSDFRISPTENASNAVLVLGAKDGTGSAYTGGNLSISSCGVDNDRYVVQRVTGADMAAKFSLVGLSDYHLAYDGTNNALQIKRNPITVTPPSNQEGYTVTTVNDVTMGIITVEHGGSFSFKVTIQDGYYKTDGFVVKANDTEPSMNRGIYTISNITENQTVTVEGVEKDTTAPAAEIKLGTNTWNSFLNSITFGLFFKETQSVTITATDNETGVAKTEYFVSDTVYADSTALEDAVNGGWLVYSNGFSIEPNSKNIIYAKVTDNADNVTYVSSNGVVLYTDAAQDTVSVSFTKTSTVDITAGVKLNGNTIDEIYCDGTPLAYGENYTVNSDTITFKAAWLDTLSTGEYTLTVHYNPMGVEYVGDDGDGAPATTSIALSVQKAAGSVTNLSDISKIYDGQSVSNVIYQASSTGDAKVEYKVRGDENSTYTTAKPSAVGEYTVRVTVAADDDYNEASATADFAITYLDTPNPAYTLSGTEGQNGWYTSDVTITPPEGYTVSSTLDGEYSESLTISTSTTNISIHLKNEQGQMTDAISVVEIKIDKDDPFITATGNTSDYQTSDTVEITVSDNTSGVAKVEVQKDNGEFTDITSSYESGYSVTENSAYTFRVTDNAGRTAEQTLEYDRIDSAKPVVTINATHGGETYTSGAWTNKDITLTPTNETSNLGTTTYQYRVDGGEWQDYTAPIVISADTDADGVTYTFKATSASDVVSDEASIIVKLDKTAPGSVTVSHKTDSFKEFLNTITFGLFFKDTQTVTITAADTGSGVKEISYQLGNGELQTKTADESGKITFNVEPQFVGNISGVIVTDNAGNSTSATVYEYFAVDAQTPGVPTVNTGSYASGEWTDEDVTITVSGVTADSGIAKYQYSTDNGASWQNMTASETTEATTTTPPSVDEAQLIINASTTADGTTYLFRAVSNSGMEGTASSDVVVKIDKTQPAIAVSGNTVDYLQSDTVTITPQVGVSGIASVTVSKDNGEAVDITESYQNGYEVTENSTYAFTVTNGAGVTATGNITYTNIDTATPIVVIDSNGYTDGAWTNSDVTLEVSNSTENLGETTFEYKVDNGQWQTYTAPIVISADTDADGVTYTFKATSASGVGSEEASITVKLDKIAPNGDITIEENSVKAFINTVTFGLFFNENVDVAITGTDDLSDVASIRYYCSEAILTEAQVADLADEDWTEYTGTISVTAEDAEQFVYYVRITDNAGNTTCFASNGATFDLTDPVISGVANQGEYYTTQTVQVTDDNLDTVTLNGSAASSEITLSGNVDADTEYIIIATDKAGNTTTVTVTMKPTASLNDTVEGIAPENVSSSDKEAIEDYLDDLNTRLEDENLTNEEKEIIQNLIDDAQDLLDKIDEMEQAANTENIQQAEDITADNVKPEDKENLEAAKEDIEQALEDHAGNYTEDEKAQLEEALQQIEDALDVIQRVEDVEEVVGGLPENVSPDDIEAAEQINAAKEQYDALSEHGQSLISDEAIDKLNDLLAQLGDYRIIEGDGSTWTKGSSEGLIFVANGAYSKFTGVEIDGVVISAENYMADSGSTKIVLTTNYLSTLTADQHTIAVLYTDGEATGTFTIAEQPADEGTDSPQTGDDSHIVLWIMLTLISGGAVLTLSVKRRNKKA